MSSQITASVDTALIQEKANEFATKGALKAIEEFYTGYNSPYKQAITNALEGKEVDTYRLQLPDICALINEKLSTEIDAIANTAIAKTFVPMVQRLLTRHEKEAKFSDILKLYIKSYDDADYDNFNVEVIKNDQYEWLNIELSDTKRQYLFTLHLDSPSNKEGKPKFKLLSLPDFKESDSYNYKTSQFKNRQVMKVSLDGATLELPFTKDILADSFISGMAGYVLANTLFTIDTREFDEDMFPETCHCH